MSKKALALPKVKTFHVADLARAIKIEPTTARRRLRVNWEGKRKPGDEWTFPVSMKAKVMKIIRGE